MARSAIPEDVLRFIERRIDSVPHLEALLLLWEDPTSSWTAADIAARVYISSEQAQCVLKDLVQHGLILAAKPLASYTYHSGWDEPQLMKRVAASYREHLVQMSRLIHSKSASEAVRDFARAFKLKGED